MKVWIGRSLILIAIGHSMIGLILYRSILKMVLKDGVFNTISLIGNPDRAAAFWFLYSGFLLLLIGSFVNYLEKLDLDIPLFFVVIFSILIALGIIAMPISGFWLLIAPMLGLINRRMHFYNRPQ